jgi:hypothetical protein
MRQQIARWVERGCERLDERMCALANLTDDAEDDSLPTTGTMTLSAVLGERLA